MAYPPLPRTVSYKNPPMVGIDIDGHGRALHRYLDDGHLDEYVAQPDSVRRTYGTGKVELAKKAAEKAHLPQYGIIGPNLYEAMQKAGAYDKYANALLLDYMNPPMPKLIWPLDAGWESSTSGWVHPTSGIRGNYALDFMAKPNTPILAVESGTITRISGYNPTTGVHGAGDVFGWSYYLRTLSSFGFYYGTHLGRVFVGAGQKVRVGDIIGLVGNWPHDPPRSHHHLGFTSFTYLSYVSKKKIVAVSNSPRVEGRILT